MPYDHGADPCEQTRVKVNGVASVAPLQRKPRENRVKRVADTRADTEQQTLARDADAAHKTRDQATAREGRNDRDDLDRRELLLEKQRRQQRDHDGRDVQKYRGGGQAHHGDGGEVAESKEKEA